MKERTRVNGQEEDAEFTVADAELDGLADEFFKDASGWKADVALMQTVRCPDKSCNFLIGRFPYEPTADALEVECRKCGQVHKVERKWP